MKSDIEKCNEWHDKAMEMADLAIKHSKAGSNDQLLDAYSKAFDMERRAALVLLHKYDVEPSRSILFRSAAWLAFNAENFREAERMAAYGLSGNTPELIASELREVLEKAISKIKETQIANAA